GLGVRLPQALVEGQPLKPLIARLREADERVFVAEGEPPEKAGAKGARRKSAHALAQTLDDPKFAGSRIHEPKLAAMHARRMGHRQTFTDDGVGHDVDDHAAIGARVAPTVDHVRTGSPR